MKYYHYFIIGLLVIIIFQQECSGPGFGGRGGNDTIFIKSEKVYDSTRHYIPIHTPAVVDSVIVEVPANVDSAAIIRNYYTEKKFQDEWRDSNLVINYSGKVFMNSVKDFQLSYKNLRPTEEKKYSIAEHKVKVFAGPNGGIDRSGRIYAGAQVALINKKENLYTADLDLINQGIKLGILWKLSFKKPPRGKGQPDN